MGTGRLVRSVVSAALLVGVVCLGPPASAVGEETAPSGELPFGEEVEPGETLQDAAPVTTGTYVLPVPDADQPHYFEVERTAPDDTVWYGVTGLLSVPVGDARLAVVGTADGVESEECNGLASSETIPRGLATNLFSSNRNGVCSDAETITIEVTNLPVFGDPLPTSDSYQLTIWVEPALERTDLLPGPNENPPFVDGEIPEEREPVEGATTFADAEVLADGGYRTTVRKGRPAIFAFPLTYGQHAQVLAGAPDPVESEGTLELTPQWVTPLGGQVRATEPLQSPFPREMPLSGEPGVWATPIVTWTNRQRTGDVSFAGTGGGNGTAAPAAFAGTYFLVLELPDDDIYDFPDELEVEMVVRTVTDYEGSEPAYATDPPALSSLDGSGFAATAEQARAAELARREAEADPPPWPLAVGLLVLAGLLALGGGLAVGRLLRGRS